jgi:hypothetical protein
MTRGVQDISQLHHINPLKTGLFPTAALPEAIRHSPLNLELLSLAKHRAAHEALMRTELYLATLFNPATTAGRIGYAASNKCGCK